MNNFIVKKQKIKKLRYHLQELHLSQKRPEECYGECFEELNLWLKD